MYFKFYIFIGISLEIFWIAQWFHVGRVIGTWQAIRQMSIRNKWNPVGLWKIFIWIFTCENADIPYNCLYPSVPKKKVSLVNHLGNHLGHVLVHKWRTSDAPYRKWPVTCRWLVPSESLGKIRIFPWVFTCEITCKGHVPSETLGKIRIFPWVFTCEITCKGHVPSESLVKIRIFLWVFN